MHTRTSKSQQLSLVLASSDNLTTIKEAESIIFSSRNNKAPYIYYQFPHHIFHIHQSTVKMSAISGNDRDRAMQIMNDARSELGFQPLVWDDNLAQQASGWAQHLADIGSMEHNHDPTDPPQGENLYAEMGTDGSTLGEQGAQAWTNEKPNYHGENIGDGDFGSYGHYSKFDPFLRYSIVLLTSRSSSRLAKHNKRWNWFCDRAEWMDLRCWQIFSARKRDGWSNSQHLEG